MKNDENCKTAHVAAFLQDKSLNASARGVLATMLSLPADEQITIESLSRILPDGKSAISSALKSLEKKGYFMRECVRNPHGRFIWYCRFSGEPVFLDGRTK